MRAKTTVVRILAAMGVAATTMTFTAAKAEGWPVPLTQEQQRFIADARGAGFPGDDDAVMLAGTQACRNLYTGQASQQVVDGIAAAYGASPRQAAGLVNAARGTICTQAPG